MSLLAILLPATPPKPVGARIVRPLGDDPNEYQRERMKAYYRANRERLKAAELARYHRNKP